MGFTTVPEALRAAGKAGQAAVGALRGADCGTPAQAVSAALPGGRAAGEASAFASDWKATLDAWCGDAERQAAALVSAAGAYAASDDHARAAVPDPHSMRGPR